MIRIQVIRVSERRELNETDSHGSSFSVISGLKWLQVFLGEHKKFIGISSTTKE